MKHYFHEIAWVIPLNVEISHLQLNRSTNTRKMYTWLLGFQVSLGGFLQNILRCRHTSGRSVLLPFGNTGYPFVRDGTTLACRCVLLILVAAWRKVRWLLEQPENSVLPLLPQWQWMLSVVEVRVNNFGCCFSFMIICMKIFDHQSQRYSSEIQITEKKHTYHANFTCTAVIPHKGVEHIVLHGKIWWADTETPSYLG